MHRNGRTFAQQQRRLGKHAASSDFYTFFSLLTSPQLLNRVESLLPDHRERVFPPTETFSIQRLLQREAKEKGIGVNDLLKNQIGQAR